MLSSAHSNRTLSDTSEPVRLPNTSLPPDNAEEECAHACTEIIVEDEVVSMSDGDIVLLPRDSEKAFRVYREILERESPVFKELIARELPTARRMKDGSPIIDMPDREDDLRTLVSVLFLGKDYYYAADKPVSVSSHHIEGLVRMGHKYVIQDLVDDGIARLKRYYPVQPAAWNDTASRERYVNSVGLEPSRVIQLALLTDTPSLLPCALLECCERTMSNDPMPDGTRPACFPEITTVPERLHWCVARGTANLTNARAVRLLAVIRAAPCEFCQRKERCALGVQRVLRSLDADELRSATHLGQWFIPVQDWLWAETEFGLCGPCDATARQVDRQMMVEAWCGLPRMFDIEVKDWPVDVDLDV